MGIPRGTIRLLLDEKRRQAFQGSVLELGRMSIYCTLTELQKWAQMHQVALQKVVNPQLSHAEPLAKLNCIDDKTFFTALGFEEVHSCDYSNWEKADSIVDLNQPVPKNFENRFDVVFEAGTIQHVFHLPNVLQNIHRCLKVGGRVIHGMTTSHNHVDHGFYMFSPTLFYDFYTANHYEINSAYLLEFSPFWFGSRFYSPPWKIYEYRPGCIDHLSYGGFGNQQLAIFLVATKKAESTGDAIPQQGYFIDFWQQQTQISQVSDTVVSDSSMSKLVRKLFLRYAWWRTLMLTYKFLRKRILGLLPKKMPPLVARY